MFQTTNQPFILVKSIIFVAEHRQFCPPQSSAAPPPLAHLVQVFLWREGKTRGDHCVKRIKSGDKKWGTWDLNLESHVLEIFTYLYIYGDEQRHGDSIYIYTYDSQKIVGIFLASNPFCGTQFVNPG